MRIIISVISIMGLLAGGMGAWYFATVKTIIDRCGGSQGLEGGITVCQNVYGTSPLLYLFVGILILSLIGLVLTLTRKNPKSVR